MPEVFPDLCKWLHLNSESEFFCFILIGIGTTNDNGDSDDGYDDDCGDDDYDNGDDDTKVSVVAPSHTKCNLKVITWCSWDMVYSTFGALLGWIRHDVTPSVLHTKQNVLKSISMGTKLLDNRKFSLSLTHSFWVDCKTPLTHNTEGIILC